MTDDESRSQRMSTALSSGSLVFSILLLLVFLHTGSRAMSTAASSSCSDPVGIMSELRQAFPTVESYEILQTIEQASAVGYKVKLLDSTTATTPEQVFVKQVVAGRYTNREWPDLRRAMLYARTEARLYDEFAPLLNDNKNKFVPDVYLATCNLQGWIREDETGHKHGADTSVVVTDLPLPRGGTLILECIPDDAYFQDSPLTLPQCRLALTAVARLHAAAWQKKDLLGLAEQRLSRCSFHLSMRNPKEVAGIVEAWEHFVKTFGTDLKNTGVWSDRIAKMGERVGRVAEYVSGQVSVENEDEPFATLVHGDYKSMNVFLPRDEKMGALLVDFASVGVGLGVSDVAMHVHHAVLPEILDADDNEEALVRHYWQSVCDNLTPEDRKAYTFELALRQYKFAVVDYFRFFLGRFWKSSTPASMEKLKENKNTNLINRSVPAAVAFVARVDRYLATVEQEFGSDSKTTLA